MAGKSLREPATGREIAEIREDQVSALDEAVATARSQQEAWAEMPLRARARIIRRLSRVISERQDELATVISRCTGKTRTEAIAGDVAPIGMGADWYAKAACRYLKPKRITRGHFFFFLIKRSRIYREPLGVIGIISPWNYPFSIPMHEVIMALVAGNGVVLKVATQVQPVGDAIVSLLDQIGIPSGLVGLVSLPGKTAGEAMLASGIDKLMFTGSVKVGKELAAGAARRLLPVGLELGGNDPMVVLSDAPLHRAVRGALWAGLSNAGQSCGGVERVIVEAPVYDRFREMLAEAVAQLRVGADSDHDSDLGSLTSARQLESVKEQVADAIRKGATIVAQSGAPDSSDDTFFHPAMLLEQVDNTMDVIRYETFGPILTLQKADDEEDAIRIANDTDLGLSASVWSISFKRARRVAARINAGSIGINDHLMMHGMAETPWGGNKDSSVGRTHGQFGLESMTKPKVVVAGRLPRSANELWWFPDSPRAYEALTSMLRFLYGPGRLRAAWKLLPAFIAGIIRAPRLGGKARPEKAGKESPGA